MWRSLLPETPHDLEVVAGLQPDSLRAHPGFQPLCGMHLRDLPPSSKSFLPPGRTLITHASQCGYLLTYSLHLKLKRMNRPPGTWASRQFIPANIHGVPSSVPGTTLEGKGHRMGQTDLSEPQFPPLSGGDYSADGWGSA